MSDPLNFGYCFNAAIDLLFSSFSQFNWDLFLSSSCYVHDEIYIYSCSAYKCTVYMVYIQKKNLFCRTTMLYVKCNINILIRCFHFHCLFEHFFRSTMGSVLCCISKRFHMRKRRQGFFRVDITLHLTTPTSHTNVINVTCYARVHRFHR